MVEVRIWDTVGEEQILKAEYKVLAGRVYVVFLHVVLASCLQELVAVVKERFRVGWGEQAYNCCGRRQRQVSPSVEMLSAVSLLTAVYPDHRFGHAFMMDTGSSTGEIIGHSKVSRAKSSSSGTECKRLRRSSTPSVSGNNDPSVLLLPRTMRL